MSDQLTNALNGSDSMENKRFLMIGNSAGSLTSLRKELLQELTHAGLEVHAAAPGLAADSVHAVVLRSMGVQPHDVPLQRAGTNPIADLSSTWRLYKLIRKLRPQIVLTYTIKPVIYGTVAAWLARTPHRFALIAGLGHMFVDERLNLLRRLIHCMYTFALGRVDKVFLQNPDDLELLRKRGVLPKQTMAVVVNGSGVDLERFSSTAVPGGELRFLMTCRLLGDKGVREYAEAARRIRALHPETSFALAGGLDANPSSITQAELDHWRKKGTLEYLGVLADVRPALASCTVFVLPSWYREGTPRAILEALSTGRAIITTDAPGCRETVVEGQNGFLIDVKSVEALVTAMERFIGDKNLAPRMGIESRVLAEDKYDVHKVNAVMLSEMDVAMRPYR